MGSFKDNREALVAAFDNKFITEDEFVLLYHANLSKNLIFPHNKYDRLYLEEMDEAECFAEFRVKKQDVVRLADALGLPESFSCPQRTKTGRIEGLCVYLKRLTYPCRLSDMIHRFGRAVPELSMISSTVEQWLYEHHHQRITQWNETLLNSDALQLYADAIAQSGAALTNCFGFVDGTVRPICRPGKNQRVVYNGHKRVHALKFQSLTTPNGIIANLFGPIEGRRHDAAMLRESRLLLALEDHAFSPNGEPMCIYGDPAYPLRIHLQAPFRDRVLTPQMQAFNKSMSSVRESVEWIFGDVICTFKFLDFKKNLKIGLSAVGKHYVVSALLRNAITCLYGNSSSKYFGVDPPSVEEYFN